MGFETLVLICLSALLGVAYIRLWRRHQRDKANLKLLFEAVENADYTLRFTERSKYGRNIINHWLNRIKEVLQRARDEQMEHEKYFEMVLNATTTGLLVVDERDNILMHNRAALQLLHTDILTHMGQIPAKTLTDERLARHETTTTLRGKRVRIMTLSNVEDELDSHEVDSWIKLTRVLTHEIMNTITPITSLTGTLLTHMEKETQEGTVPDKELKRGLETIKKTGEELLKFVQTYRRFTHVPSPSPTLFYAKPFLKRMASLYPRPIETLSEPQDLLIYADESLISHVVNNLLKNAVEATRQEDAIHIKAWTDEQEAVIIDVTNKGNTIPANVAEHIFVPFFTTKPEGSGIGLSLARQIMRASGGTLTLHQDEDMGTVTFRLRLP
ncbi:MAG: sensor histidine kinase [Bacteroidaceae bacterium]